MKNQKLILLIGLLFLSQILCEDGKEEKAPEDDKPKIFYLWDGKNSGSQSIFVLDKDIPEGEEATGEFVKSDPVWTQGIIGQKAVILEDLDQIITINDVGQSLKAPFTISLWVAFNIFMQNQNQILFEYRDSAKNVFNIFNNKDNKFEANLIVDNRVTASLIGNNVWSDQGQWHHLVFIVDPTLGGAMFIDGVAESENSTDFASFSLGEITRVSLGATSDSFPENIVNATIDDFRRFPEAISEETLKKLFCTDGNKQYGEDSCAPSGQEEPKDDGKGKALLVQKKLSRRQRKLKQRN